VNVEPSEADELLLDLGERLTTRRGLMDRGEAAWLRLLADFDRHELWQLDGQASCVDWLVWRAGLAVGTAYEKRRIAQELQRRPLLAEAFEAGDISYSAVRAITRLDDPDPEVDARLIDVAKAGTVRDLETLVLRYKNYADQERDPEEARSLRRGIRIRRGYDGLSTAEVTLTNLEIDEFVAALRAYSEHHGAPPKSDSSEEVKGAGDHSPQDDDPADPAPAARSLRTTRQDRTLCTTHHAVRTRRTTTRHRTTRDATAHRPPPTWYAVTTPPNPTSPTPTRPPRTPLLWKSLLMTHHAVMTKRLPIRMTGPGSGPPPGNDEPTRFLTSCVWPWKEAARTRGSRPERTTTSSTSSTTRLLARANSSMALPFHGRKPTASCATPAPSPTRTDRTATFSTSGDAPGIGTSIRNEPSMSATGVNVASPAAPTGSATSITCSPGDRTDPPTSRTAPPFAATTTP
jgi:hypothetical protein